MTVRERQIIKNQGIALISVLIALAIITPIIYQVALRQKMSVDKAFVQISTGNAIMDALAVETWGRNTLLTDLQTNTYDHYGEVWSQGLPKTFSEGAIVSGEINDLNARLNLNNLWYAEDDDFVKILQKLFVELGVNTTEAAAIINAMQDWLDADTDVRAGGGGEDNYYMALDTPYRCANNLFASLTELKLLRGMNLDIYQKISPYLTVLPEKTKVNVNTATPEVLQAIFPQNAWTIFAANTDKESALQLKTLEELQQEYLSVTTKDIPPQILSYVSISSNYFAVNTTSSLGEAKIKLNSILKRDSHVRIINRFLN